MDAVEHIEAARELRRQIAELHARMDDHLFRASVMARSAFDHWTATMRDSTRPCPPSELPDARLGPELRRVRDFLRPAPGRPVDPEFDRTVAVLGGPDNARRMLDGATNDAPGLWAWLREQAGALGADPQAERME